MRWPRWWWEPGANLLVVTELGFGKFTPLNEYPVKGRATYGVVTIDQKSLDKTGRIAAARVVNKTDEITIITSGGIAIRLRLKNSNPSGRSTRGNRLINLEKGDKVSTVARLAETFTRAASSNGGDGSTPPNGSSETTPEIFTG